MTPQNASNYMFKGHGNAITILTFSQDGKTLVSSGYDGRTLVWEVETGAIRTAFPFKYREGAGCLFPDGSKIATSTGIYDTFTGTTIRRLRKPTISACSPDGRLLVSPVWLCNDEESENGCVVKVLLFDPRTGHTKKEIPLSSFAGTSFESVESFVFSPEGDFLAFIGHEPMKTVENTLEEGSVDYVSERSVFLYEMNTEKLVLLRRGTNYRRLYWVSNPSGIRLLCHDWNAGRIWDMETGKLVQEFPFQNRWDFQSATLSPNGSLLAVAWGNGTVEVYDIATKKKRWNLSCHESWVRALAFTSDSRKLASAGNDHAILIHDSETGERLHTVMAAIPRVEALSFTTDGGSVSALYEDGSARLWNLATRSLEKQVFTLPKILSDLSHKKPDMARHFWSLPFEDLPHYKPPVYWVPAIAVSPDGTLIAIHRSCAVSFTGGSLMINWVGDPATYPYLDELPAIDPNAIEPSAWVIWDVVQHKIRSQIPLATMGTEGVFLDNTRFVCSDDKNRITVYSVETGESLQILDQEDHSRSELVASPHGDLLAIMGWDSLSLWDMETGEATKLDWILDDGLALAFFPEGKRVVNASPHCEEACIQGFNHEEGIGLEGHTGNVRGVACSPDGTLVATGAQDGMVKVWDAKEGALKVTFQALPEGQWVSYTPEGEVVGSPGAETYLLRTDS